VSWDGNVIRQPTFDCRPAVGHCNSIRADSGYRAEVSTLDRVQSRIIPAMHTATEKYATTNNTLAMNGTLAMSGALRAPRTSPSNPIIALDARGSNAPGRRPAILLTVLVNRPAPSFDARHLTEAMQGGSHKISGTLAPATARLLCADFLGQ
jgi:hypothetical protein